MGVHEAATSLHIKYGNIVRVLPTGVAISDPDEIWRVNSARSTYARGGWYDAMRFNPFGRTVFSEMDVAKHDARKAKLIHGFTGKGLMDLETNVDVQIATLVGFPHFMLSIDISSYIQIDVLKSHIIEDKGQAVVNIGLLLQYFQVDLITQAGLGEVWGDLTDEKDHFGYLAEGDVLVPFVQATAWVPCLRAILFSSQFLAMFGPSLTDGWLG